MYSGSGRIRCTRNKRSPDAELVVWTIHCPNLVPSIATRVLRVSEYIPACACGTHLLIPASRASIYMSLGRQIRAMRHEELSLISTKWMTKIFVLGDILSFLTQGAGGGIESQRDANSVTVGAWIIVGGLVIQLIWFGFFVVVAGVFHFRLNKAATSSQVLQATGWRRFINVLYLACALILIRSIYRTIEFAEGSNGYLMQYEAYFYVFDAALMTVVVGLYNLFPPKELGGRRPQGGGTELRSLDAEDQRLSKP